MTRRRRALVAIPAVTGCTYMIVSCSTIHKASKEPSELYDSHEKRELKLVCRREFGERVDA